MKESSELNKMIEKGNKIMGIIKEKFDIARLTSKIQGLIRLLFKTIRAV